MRAKIVGMIVLTAVVALTTSFAPAHDELTPTTTPRLLTEEEADCLVGGEMSCLEEGMFSWVECMIDEGVDVTDGRSINENLVTVGACFWVGVGDGAWCAMKSVWDWIF